MAGRDELCRVAVYFDEDEELEQVRAEMEEIDAEGDGDGHIGWTLPWRGDGQRVAVFDSGVDAEHPDLAEAVAG